MNASSRAAYAGSGSNDLVSPVTSRPPTSSRSSRPPREGREPVNDGHPIQIHTGIARGEGSRSPRRSSAPAPASPRGRSAAELSSSSLVTRRSDDHPLAPNSPCSVTSSYSRRRRGSASAGASMSVAPFRPARRRCAAFAPCRSDDAVSPGTSPARRRPDAIAATGASLQPASIHSYPTPTSSSESV